MTKENRTILLAAGLGVLFGVGAMFVAAAWQKGGAVTPTPDPGGTGGEHPGESAVRTPAAQGDAEVFGVACRLFEDADDDEARATRWMVYFHEAGAPREDAPEQVDEAVLPSCRETIGTTVLDMLRGEALWEAREGEVLLVQAGTWFGAPTMHRLTLDPMLAVRDGDASRFVRIMYEVMRNEGTLNVYDAGELYVAVPAEQKIFVFPAWNEQIDGVPPTARGLLPAPDERLE